MPRAMRIHRPGGPGALSWDEVEVGDPGPGEARVRHTAIGVNFLDTYHRSGRYPLPLPAGIGSEAAGVVEAVGAGVDEVRVGDRVAYCTGPPGSYSEARVVAAERLVRLPEGIEDRVAASLMLKGLTVQYLFRRTKRLERGDTILFHAAAGGVGLIACQWARALGVTMIGTVGTDDKAALAREHGCAHVVVYTRENFVERVREITGGRGVPVVYDSVGRATFPASLECLEPFGLFVTFGGSSGPVPPVDTALLARGSIFMTRPTIFVYAAKRPDLLAMAQEVFDLAASGALRCGPRRTFALKDAAEAHRALESRRTTGAVVLLP